MSSDARTAHQGAEDGFHEIQLSGKQLVFLFMATTVVSIVIFLCGVLVGRGARVETPDLVEAAAPEPAVAPVTTGAPVVNSAAPVDTTAPADASTPTKVESDDFNYMKMLTAEQSTNEVPQPPAETTPEPPAASQAAALQPPAVTPTSTKPLEKAPAPAAPPASAPAVAAPPAAKPAAGGAITIQVAALKERGEADRIAKRLQAKGFDAYVADPAPGTAMFRVRVGHFNDRSEAEKVKARLAKEEKFRPWVTR